MATVKTKLNVDSEALKKIKLVAVAYSFVNPELFPNEEAYKAEKEVEDRAQEVIEEIKKRVPVWKLEHYQDGTREWVRAETGGTVHAAEQT